MHFLNRGGREIIETKTKTRLPFLPSLVPHLHSPPMRFNLEPVSKEAHGFYLTIFLGCSILCKEMNDVKHEKYEQTYIILSKFSLLLNFRRADLIFEAYDDYHPLLCSSLETSHPPMQFQFGK